MSQNDFPERKKGYSYLSKEHKKWQICQIDIKNFKELLVTFLLLVGVSCCPGNIS
jgi:hypothetical protein